MEVQEQIKQIKAQLRRYMNGTVSDAMRKRGVRYRLNFGVELPRLKAIAAEYEPDFWLAQALWKEEVRESKLLATMLQPVETFDVELADIWVEQIDNVELAAVASKNLFERLPYAPSLCMRWIASDAEYKQICGYYTMAGLLSKKGDMPERAANEFLDQAVAAFLAGGYPVRTAVTAALRKYMRHSADNAFLLCRRVESLKDSANADAQLLYGWVRDEVDGMEA